MKWLEIDQDNLHTKFSAFNVDFSSSSPDPLGSSRFAQAGVKDSYPLKSGYFFPQLSRVAWTRLQICTDMLPIITSTGDRLFKFINIDDLEWPWTFPKGVLVNFSQYLDAAHISILNCDEMAGVRPRQPVYEIFSIKRRFQQSKSWSPRFMEPGAGGRQRLQRFRAVQVYIIHKVAPR